MDRLAQYRRLIQNQLGEFVEWANSDVDEESEVICLFDEKHDHYMVLRAHWGQYRCVHGAQIFIRIRNGKIWIEEDWTQDGIATARNATIYGVCSGIIMYIYILVTRLAVTGVSVPTSPKPSLCHTSPN